MSHQPSPDRQPVPDLPPLPPPSSSGEPMYLRDEAPYANDPPYPNDPRLQTTVVQEVPVHDRYVVAAEPAVERRTRATARRWAFDSAVCGAVGIVFAVVGLIAVTRGGFDGSLSDPIVDVVGFQHTTLLGLIEIGVGAVLLLAAAVASRGAAVFFGVLLGIGSFVGAIESDRFADRLGLESNFAWISFVLALVVVLAALLVPRITSQTTTYEVDR